MYAIRSYYAAGDEFAFRAGKGAGVDHELHGQGGFVDLQQGQGLGLFGIGHGGVV